MTHFIHTQAGLPGKKLTIKPECRRGTRPLPTHVCIADFSSNSRNMFGIARTKSISRSKFNSCNNKQFILGRRVKSNLFSGDVSLSIMDAATLNEQRVIGQARQGMKYSRGRLGERRPKSEFQVSPEGGS